MKDYLGTEMRAGDYIVFINMGIYSADLGIAKVTGETPRHLKVAFSVHAMNRLVKPHKCVKIDPALVPVDIMDLLNGVRV